MELHFDINLTKKQKEIYDLCHNPDVREIVAVCSRQIGKTTIAEILMIEALLSKRGTVYYISPDFAQGKKVYREVLNLLSPTGLIKAKNSTDLTIETVNGGFLGFFSCKNPTAIRGTTVSSLLVLDEFAFFPEETADGQDLFNMVIRPITKAKKPKTLYISTPNGKSGAFYDKYNEGLGKTDGNIRTVVATIYDDEMMSPEEVEELRLSMPPLAWQQEYLVKFLDNALTAFDGFEDRFTKYRMKDVDTSKPCWAGVDFSANGEDETILTIVDKDNRNRQWHITGTLDKRYEEMARILDGCTGLRGCYMECNGIGEPMINEVRKRMKKNRTKCRYWTTTNDSKAGLVGNLQLLISQGEIEFPEENTELFRQFGWFGYEVNKKTRRITYGAKAPRHDDRVMSLMMALQAKEDMRGGDASSYVVIQTRQSGAGLR